MGVSTAMYAAITGLNAMGTAMSVISNNIANVNTIGFKASRAEFQDLLSQRANTASGYGQIGRGVQVGAVTQVFSQGAFKNSTQDTDIAIAGEGFFKVRDQISGELLYTRAGNFIFDKDGRMVHPGGHVLQGWELDPNNLVNNKPAHVGVERDILIDQVNSPPEVTTRATYVFNLNAEDISKTDNVPLSYVWRGDQPTNPIDGTLYTYQTSLRVYDSLGAPHDLSVFFDPDNAVDNKWDYIITGNPDEDMRTDNGNSVSDPVTPGTPLQGTKFAGLFGRGTITFEPTDPVTGNGGIIRDITADDLIVGRYNENNVAAAALGYTGGWPGGNHPVTPSGTYTGTDDPATFNFRVVAGTGGALAGGGVVLEWQKNGGGWCTAAERINLNNGGGPYSGPEGTRFSIGTPGAPANLVDGSGFDITNIAANWQASTPNANGYFDFDSSFITDPGPVPVLGTPILQNIEINFGARNPAGTGPWTLDNMSATQYSAPSTTVFQTQDGFASGYLQRISIDTDGIITGTYSNGRQTPMYQIGIAKFRNQWGLDKLGENLYAETRISGPATYNNPGTAGAGTVSPNSLEQSNVDLADEFVDMIVQQRGFQANSKVIATTDAMLAELINLKR